MKQNQSLIAFGLAAGLINVLGWFIGNQLLGDTVNSETFGYIAMLLSLSLVFVGVKQHKTKKNGQLSFREGFMKGLIIVVVSSLVYVIGWELYFPNFLPDFATDYQAQLVADLQNQGLSDAEIQSQTQELAQWMKNYENPFIRMPLTFFEIFPIGLIISVFCALVLRTRNSD